MGTLPIVVAGAGIAGLSAALAFAARGFSVEVFERAPVLEEVGAGVQLSPNATRLLARLDVLGRLRGTAVRPHAIQMKKASSLRTIARLPLGEDAEDRWKAPYLVVHRAVLQAALVARVKEMPAINVTMDASVRGLQAHAQGVGVTVERPGGPATVDATLLVAADGVWSNLRGLLGETRASRFTGHIAWRTVLDTEAAADVAAEILPPDTVTAFLSPRFHLVAYPLHGGRMNLVAVTRGVAREQGWQRSGEPAALLEAMAEAAGPLTRLAARTQWTTWPIHETAGRGPWTKDGRVALIGDAAHAMTPFAAQGAAMAIEDAYVLAKTVGRHRDDLDRALKAYEALRRPRIASVARRAAFNGFVWHAAGPLAFGRDIVLRLRRPAGLAADFDWLYGWDPDADRA